MPDATLFNPTAYGDLTGANRWVWYVTHVLFEQKFMTIFSMLFGAGILLMTGRVEAKGLRSAPLHYRRMTVLLGFGLLHAYLVWTGDILVCYAMCGFLVYLFRHREPRSLVKWGVGFVAVASLLSLLFGWSMRYWPAGSIEELEQAASPSSGSHSGDPRRLSRRVISPSSRTARPTRSSRRPSFSSSGVSGARAGSCSSAWPFSNKASSARRDRRGSTSASSPPRSWPGSPRRSTARGGISTRGGTSATPSSSEASTTTGRAFSSRSAGSGSSCSRANTEPRGSFTPRLAAVGRMAFSNYLAQSLICTTIFYGHGLGLFGSVDRVTQALVVIGIWVLQLAVSPWWLARFRFGPCEWAWRSLTYGKRQPMRR